tara:strand:+ start:73908 stop:74825 length:918 start_codon:yes stop_codon:yes gene_type:complete
MFNKIEFSDLYKFLTSTGLIVLGSAFFIPWLFMKQDQGLLISESEYKLLNEQARLLFDSRIELNLLISKSILWFSLALLIIGISTMCFGIWKWSERQKILDEAQNIDIAEKRVGQKNLKPSEVLRKADSEIEEEIEAKADDNKENIVKEITPEKRNMLKSNLIDLENLFYQKILEFNTFNYKVSSNIKIADKYRIDLLLNSYNNAKHRDVLVEMKFLQNKLSMQLIRDSYKHFREAFIYYTNTTQRKGTMVFIVVYRNDIADDKEMNRFIKAFFDFRDEINNSNVKFIIMDDDEAERFDVKEIIG